MDLKEIKRLKDRIETREKLIEEIRESMYDISAVQVTEKVQTSKETGDNIGNDIARIERLEKQLKELKEEYNKRVNEVLDATIDMEEEFAYIIVTRYIKAKEWEEIANEMHYSVGYVYKLHNKALDSLYKIVNNSY